MIDLKFIDYDPKTYSDLSNKNIGFIQHQKLSDFMDSMNYATSYCGDSFFKSYNFEKCSLMIESNGTIYVYDRKGYLTLEEFIERLCYEDKMKVTFNLNLFNKWTK